MKRAAVILISISLVFSLAACSLINRSSNETEAETVPAIAEQETEEETEAIRVDGFPAHVVLTDRDSLKGKTVGFSVCSTTNDEWSVQLVKAIQKIGEYYGAEVNWSDAEFNKEDQIVDIEGMLVDEYDVVFVDPVSHDGPSEAFEEAEEENIPVISCFTKCDTDATAHIDWSAADGGETFAEYFKYYVNEHNDSEEVKLLELTNTASERAQQRLAAFHNRLKELGVKYTVVDKCETEAQRETAYTIVDEETKDYDYIIADVDNAAQGAVAALRANGDSKTKVFSLSAYGTESFSALLADDDNYEACLNVDPWVLASYMYLSAIDSINGKPVDEVTYIDSYVVDSSNVEEFWAFE